METRKMKTTTTLVAQIPAGIEIDVLVDKDGTVYAPIFNLPFAVASARVTTPTEPASSGKTKKAPVEEPEEESEEGAEDGYTEEELMELSVSQLRDICKDLEIDPDETEGKNTHKKLRLLILESPEEAEEEPAPPVKKGKKAPVEEEPEEEEEPKPKAKKKPVVEEEEEEEAPKPKSKKGKKEELVDAADLNVGDEVSVFWATLDDWFNGEVKSKKGGKISIVYEDGETEIIDPKIHTKIKLVPAV